MHFYQLCPKRQRTLGRPTCDTPEFTSSFQRLSQSMHAHVGIDIKTTSMFLTVGLTLND
jgi:hypothetical protein